MNFLDIIAPEELRMGAVELGDLNGELRPLGEIGIPISDSGFLFGLAAYEELRVLSGFVWLHQEHLARLDRTLRELHIDYERDQLLKRIDRLVHESQIKDGLLRIIITRGNTYDRYNDLFDPKVSNEVLSIEHFYDQFFDMRSQGVKVVTYPDLRWNRRDMKTTNLLPNTVAMQFALSRGCQEAVFVSQNGTILDGSNTNVFLVKQDSLYTCPSEGNICPGITRDFVIGLARKVSLPVYETNVSEPDALLFDEILLTGTTVDVLSVVEWNDRSVSDGRPGPIASKLQRLFQEAREKWLNESRQALNVK